MKHALYIILATLLSACSYDDQLPLYEIEVRLETTASQLTTVVLSDIPVTMTDGNATSFTAKTDEEGTARFHLPAGVYNISVSAIKEINGAKYIINGNIAQHVVSSENSRLSVPLTIVSQSAHGLIIKEIYCGGCQKDDGSGIFAMDKCLILYNNSPFAAEIANLGIGMVEPYNAEAATHSFLNSGTLEYEADGTLPLINGVWYFPDTLRVKAYEEIVVNICGAIDNTQTYSNSINYADSRYYCMYDPSTMGTDGKAYANTAYYPAPSEIIPTNHYLRAVKYGMGNAWPYSVTSPATVIFQTEGTTIEAYANNPANIIYPTGKQGNLTVACLSIPRSWILDGVEVYNTDKLADCKKRLTPDIDNGYVLLTHGYGHSLLRKTDEEATQKAGHPVYLDTNNSTNDFIETEKCSIKQPLCSHRFYRWAASCSRRYYRLASSSPKRRRIIP